jgi:hypothetical protein
MTLIDIDIASAPVPHQDGGFILAGVRFDAPNGDMNELARERPAETGSRDMGRVLRLRRKHLRQRLLARLLHRQAHLAISAAVGKQSTRFPTAAVSTIGLLTVAVGSSYVFKGAVGMY